MNINNIFKSINVRKSGLVLYSSLIVIGLVIAQIAIWGSNNTQAADIVNSAGIWCRGDETDPIPGHSDLVQGSCYVPTNTEDTQNFDKCSDSSQYGEVLVCQGGFNTDGTCRGEEQVQVLDIAASESCTELADQYGASVQINVMCNDSTSNATTNIGTVTCDPSPARLNNDASASSLTSDYTIDFAINNSDQQAIATATQYWGLCSGAPRSGAECNALGTPPVGRMFGCYYDGNTTTGYGCYDVPTNSNNGLPGCFLDTDGVWKNCNCDINQCVSTCEQVFAGQPGTHQYTDICGRNQAYGCGQEFTCECYIPQNTPTPTPPITTTTTPTPTVTITTTPPTCPDTQARFRVVLDGNDRGWNDQHPPAELSTIDTLQWAVFINQDTNQYFNGNITLSGPGGTQTFSNGAPQGVPTPWQVGTYNLSAVYNNQTCDSASFTIVQSPTNTPTPSVTPSPTVTPSPSPTPIPDHITVSGSVVCLDDGRTLNGATIEILDSDPQTGNGGSLGTIEANPNYFASWSPIPGREHAIRLIDRGNEIPGTYVGPIATNDSAPCFVGSGYEFCQFQPNNTYTNVSFGFTDCAEPTITPTDTPEPSITPTITPTEPADKLVMISGDAYCQDNGDRYNIDGAVVYGYDAFGFPFRVVTDANGHYDQLIALPYDNGNYRNQIAITLLQFDENNDQIIDATNQPYSSMVPPSALNSDFAINCNNPDVTHCTSPNVDVLPALCANNSMNGSSSYANCGITEADNDYYSNFDFKFSNCTPPVITPTITVTPTSTPVPQPGIDIVKEVINDADRVYKPGETVKFRITITNTGQTTYQQVGFSDEYNQARIDFIRVINASTGNDITNAFKELGQINEELGEITHGDLTLISELGDLEPGEKFILDFEFKAIRSVTSTCNDAFIYYNPGKNGYQDEDSSRACIVIKENIPVTDK